MNATDPEIELERAQRHYDLLSREWDDADLRFTLSLQAARGTYRDVDPEVHRRRAKIGYARRSASYRLKMAEYTAARRSVKPMNPEDPDCTDSPFYNG